MESDERRRSWIRKKAEELGFVTSAVGEPLAALHICDNKCSEQGFKFFQLAAVVTEEGGAVHTINLCKHCYNERRMRRWLCSPRTGIFPRTQSLSASCSWLMDSLSLDHQVDANGKALQGCQ